MHRIIFPVFLLFVLFSSFIARAQTGSVPNFGDPLEYSMPILPAVPPIDSAQPPSVANAYLWLDVLLRTTTTPQIDGWISSQNYGDTLKFLAETDYSVIDNNPLTEEQYDIGHPRSWEAPYRWNYKANPDHERIMLQNQICGRFNDTGRTGFFLACDYIADVTVSDTFVVNSNSSLPLVFVNSTINDEIKGQQVPLCVGEGMLSRKKNGGASILSTTIWPTYAVPADTGTCLQFEYSPQWQSVIFNDNGGAVPVLSDSTGWWVRPSGEYIVFLRIAGIGSDTALDYFTIQPFWGVFGTQGAMYRVIDGIVQDPNDDFGIGASSGLSVSVWKTRLRARIYNILHP